MLGQKRKLKGKLMLGTVKTGSLHPRLRRSASTLQIRDEDGHRYEFKVPRSKMGAVLDVLRAILTPEGQPGEPSSDETTVNAVASTPLLDPSTPDLLPPFDPWPWQNPSFRDEQVFQDYMAILERNRLTDLVEEDEEG